MSQSQRAARFLREIQQIPGNEVCADCGAPGEADNRWNARVLSGVFVQKSCQNPRKVTAKVGLESVSTVAAREARLMLDGS